MGRMRRIRIFFSFSHIFAFFFFLCVIKICIVVVNLIVCIFKLYLLIKSCNNFNEDKYP